MGCDENSPLLSGTNVAAGPLGPGVSPHVELILGRVLAKSNVH